MLEKRLTNAKIQIESNWSCATIDSWQILHRVLHGYKCSVPRTRIAVVKILITVECPTPVSNLIMMTLENKPILAHLLSSEATPDIIQKVYSQIGWTPSIVSAWDGIIWHWRRRCLRIHNIQNHGIVTRIYIVHHLGPPFMDLVARGDGSYCSKGFFCFMPFKDAINGKSLIHRWFCEVIHCPICSD